MRLSPQLSSFNITGKYNDKNKNKLNALNNDEGEGTDLDLTGNEGDEPD